LGEFASFQVPSRTLTPQSPILFTFEKLGRYNELCPRHFSVHPHFAFRAFAALRRRRRFN